MKHYECRVTIGYLVQEVMCAWRMKKTFPPVYINATTPGEARAVARKQFEFNTIGTVPDWTGAKEADTVSYLNTYSPVIISVTARSISAAEMNITINAPSLFDISEFEIE